MHLSSSASRPTPWTTSVANYFRGVDQRVQNDNIMGRHHSCSFQERSTNSAAQLPILQTMKAQLWDSRAPLKNGTLMAIVEIAFRSIAILGHSLVALSDLFTAAWQLIVHRGPAAAWKTLKDIGTQFMKILHNVNHIAKAALQAVPIIGHFLAYAFKFGETMAQDTAKAAWAGITYLCRGCKSREYSPVAYSPVATEMHLSGLPSGVVAASGRGSPGEAKRDAVV